MFVSDLSSFISLLHSTFFWILLYLFDDYDMDPGMDLHKLTR